MKKEMKSFRTGDGSKTKNTRYHEAYRQGADERMREILLIEARWCGEREREMNAHIIERSGDKPMKNHVQALLQGEVRERERELGVPLRGLELKK